MIKYDSVTPSIWTPNKAYGNAYNIVSVPTIFKNATIWTNEEEGILKNTDVAIQDGKLKKLSGQKVHLEYRLLMQQTNILLAGLLTNTHILQLVME